MVTLSVTISPAQQIDFQDLTRHDPNPLRYKKLISGADCHGGGGSGSASVGCPPKSYPFELSVINGVPAEIAIGSEATALVRIRNAGHDPAVVPWSADPDMIEAPDETGTYKFLEAEIRASISQENGAASFRMPVQLYGSEKAEGSLRRVNPGEWVEIRARLVFDCQLEIFQCKNLKPGPAKISVAWTESSETVTYKDCSIESHSVRERVLTSEAVRVEIGGYLPAARVHARGHRRTCRIAESEHPGGA